MDVSKQVCNECGSSTLENLLVRESGRALAIFVRCVECQSYVARIRIKDIHQNGETLDSFLKTNPGTAAESGRELLTTLTEAQENALDQFAQVTEALNTPPTS